jgi:hypothetical protein
VPGPAVRSGRGGNGIAQLPGGRFSMIPIGAQTRPRTRENPAMNSHFSKEMLERNLEALVNRATSRGYAEAFDQGICAEARFEIDHTVQRMAYLAHLGRRATD